MLKREVSYKNYIIAIIDSLNTDLNLWSEYSQQINWVSAMISSQWMISKKY